MANETISVAVVGASGTTGQSIVDGLFGLPDHHFVSGLKFSFSAVFWFLILVNLENHCSHAAQVFTYTSQYWASQERRASYPSRSERSPDRTGQNSLRHRCGDLSYILWISGRRDTTFNRRKSRRGQAFCSVCLQHSGSLKRSYKLTWPGEKLSAIWYCRVEQTSSNTFFLPIEGGNSEPYQCPQIAVHIYWCRLVVPCGAPTYSVRTYRTCPPLWNAELANSWRRKCA